MVLVIYSMKYGLKQKQVKMVLSLLNYHGIFILNAIKHGVNKKMKKLVILV